jgi:argininosuccinate synthase
MVFMSSVNKVVLAYSGGLDTSVIVRWLQQKYGCEVVTFTADLGQGEEVAPARAKAEALGVKQIYIDDLREEFAPTAQPARATTRFVSSWVPMHSSPAFR